MLFPKMREKSDAGTQGSRFVKIAAIIGFITISLVHIITLLNPTRGYELSIYDATPSILWYCLIFSSLCGISIIVIEVYTRRCDISHSWIYGLIILLLSRITLLYIPYNRGYVAWIGDHMSHIGAVHDILTSGFIGSDNFYPITHILLSELAHISNLSIGFLTNYSTTFISTFFVISIYLVGKYLLKDKKATLLALAATGCVIFSHYDVYLMPNGWSVLFFPFALILVVKATERGTNSAYRILAVIILVMFPFFHPLSALMLTVILLVFTAINTLLNKFGCLRDRIQKYFSFPDAAHSPTLLGIILMIWMTRVLSFEIFHGSTRRFFNSIFSGIDEDVLEEMGSKISKMDFDVFDLISLVFKEEGATIIFLIFFVFGSYLAYRKEQESQRIVVFIGAILLFGFLYVSYLFNILPGLGPIAGSRILMFIKVMLPVFTGVVYAHLLSKEKTVVVLLCVGIMVIPVILTVFGTFPSPYVHRPTPQVTSMDMHGMEWSFDKKDRDIYYVQIANSPHRFADATLGKSGRLQRSDIQKDSDMVPNHFNYHEKIYFGEYYSSSKYLVLTMFDKIIYTTVYNPVGRFNEVDFARLKSDPSVQFLYSNGECEVYYIGDAHQIADTA